MNQQDFSALVNDTIRTTSALLIAKGEEYAGTSDRLANFKRGSALTGATPLQVAFVYASKHYDSLSTYIRKDAQGFKQTLSEPIEGRLDDLINYCLLIKALIVESRTKKMAEEAAGLFPGNLQTFSAMYHDTITREGIAEVLESAYITKLPEPLTKQEKESAKSAHDINFNSHPFIKDTHY